MRAVQPPATLRSLGFTGLLRDQQEEPGREGSSSSDLAFAEHFVAVTQAQEKGAGVPISQKVR